MKACRTARARGPSCSIVYPALSCSPSQRAGPRCTRQAGAAQVQRYLSASGRGRAGAALPERVDPGHGRGAVHSGGPGLVQRVGLAALHRQCRAHRRHLRPAHQRRAPRAGPSAPPGHAPLGQGHAPLGRGHGPLSLAHGVPAMLPDLFGQIHGGLFGQHVPVGTMQVTAGPLAVWHVGAGPPLALAMRRMRPRWQGTRPIRASQRRRAALTQPCVQAQSRTSRAAAARRAARPSRAAGDGGWVPGALTAPRGARRVGPGAGGQVRVLGAQPDPLHDRRQRAQLRGRLWQHAARLGAPPRRVLPGRDVAGLQQPRVRLQRLCTAHAQPQRALRRAGRWCARCLTLTLPRRPLSHTWSKAAHGSSLCGGPGMLRSWSCGVWLVGCCVHPWRHVPSRNLVYTGIGVDVQPSGPACLPWLMPQSAPPQGCPPAGAVGLHTGHQQDDGEVCRTRQYRPERACRGGRAHGLMYRVG